MSSIIGRSAFRATRALRAPKTSFEADSAVRKLTHTDRTAAGDALRRGAQRDPELYVLYAVTALTLAAAGYFLPRFSYSMFGDFAEVPKVENSEPWKENGGTGKYKFYKEGDPKKGVKEAPSALHSVVIPNVNLPKSLHDTFNKWGKDEYDF